MAGADEVDMVINIGYAKEHDWDALAYDMPLSATRSRTPSSRSSLSRQRSQTKRSSRPASAPWKQV